jgi:hypothetical protein
MSDMSIGSSTSTQTCTPEAPPPEPGVLESWDQTMYEVADVMDATRGFVTGKATGRDVVDQFVEFADRLRDSIVGTHDFLAESYQQAITDDPSLLHY